MPEPTSDLNVLRLAFRTVLAFRERSGECSAMRLDNGKEMAFLRGCESSEALAAAIKINWSGSSLARGEIQYRVDGTTRAVRMVLDITGRILVKVIAVPDSERERESLLNHEVASTFDPSEIAITPDRMTCLAHSTPAAYYRQGFEVDLEAGMSHQLHFARAALSTIYEPMTYIYDFVSNALGHQGEFIDSYSQVWPQMLAAVSDVHFLRSMPDKAMRDHFRAPDGVFDAATDRLSKALLAALTRQYLI